MIRADRAGAAQRAPRSTVEIIRGLFVVGAALLVVGLLVGYAAWPAEEMTDDGFGPTGSVVLAWIGILVAAVGQVTLLVGTIAAGVRLGHRD
jgi:hypothetical protein